MSDITPLDDWIKYKIGLSGEKGMTASALTHYQLHRLKRVIRYARRNSPFYRDRLGGLPDDFLQGPEDLAVVPFTTENDLRKYHLNMLCVSQSDVSRVVTLQTSGATDMPKRLFFTDDDLELTVDFFHHGMTTLARPKDRVLILMPGQTPGSIGDLLKKALTRMNAKGFVYGPVTDPGHAVETLLKTRPHCLVGLPVQVLGLARHPHSRSIPKGLIKSVLLSADYVPGTIVDELENRFNAPVFEHYGMTEMGLGGGVQCEARKGYHLREADLYFEVIDPQSGIPVADGEPGEVVFTTLTRKGMPLIRYRTGDLARFLSEPCPCGSSLRRLGKVHGRMAGRVRLLEGSILTLSEMDEVLFKIPNLLNYRAELGLRDGKDCLSVQAHTVLDASPEILVEIETHLMKIPSIKRALSEGQLLLDPISKSPSDWPTTGTIKRILVDDRRKHETTTSI
jgi:phenylacetate-coenzyme A ligase PaaK-like adenylate-forming protein